MFSALFRQAQATVDNAIGQAINRLIVAVPFVIAAGFATAAGTVWLVRELGPEFGLAAMAGLYMVLGCICAAFMLQASAAESGATTMSGAEELRTSQAEETEQTTSDVPVDRELLAAAATAVAPMVLPSLLRMLMANLPLVAALSALLFIFTRSSTVEEPASTT